MLNLGCTRPQMMKGPNAIFAYLKNILPWYGTVSVNTSRISKSTKEGMTMVENETGMCNPELTACIYNAKKNTISDSALTSCNGKCSSGDTSGQNDSNAQNSSHSDSIDELRLHMSMKTLKDSMEDVKSQLIDEMKNMVEENRKEMIQMMEENKKEMKNMIVENHQEIKNMVDVDRKKIGRLDANDKDLYKKVGKEYLGIEEEARPQQRKVKGKIGRVQKKTRSDYVN